MFGIFFANGKLVMTGEEMFLTHYVNLPFYRMNGATMREVSKEERAQHLEECARIGWRYN